MSEENYIASIPLGFSPAAVVGTPFRTSARIHVPFKPRVINVIGYSGTTLADVDIAYAAYLWSDLFQKGNSNSGYIAGIAFPWTNVFATTATHPMRLMFGERDIPTIQGVFVFEIRDVVTDAPITYTAGFPGVRSRLVLEFVR